MPAGQGLHSWGVGVWSGQPARRDSNWGPAAQGAADKTHSVTAEEKSFPQMLTFHFLKHQADLRGQQGLSLPALPSLPALLSPPQHFPRTQASPGACLPHQLPGRPQAASLTHPFLQLSRLLSEERFPVLHTRLHLLHPLFCCFQLCFMRFLNKWLLEINTGTC